MLHDIHDTILGTFGQTDEWILGEPSTYQHPLIPEDVLMDKSGLEMLLERTSLALNNKTATAEMEDTKPAEKTLEEKLEERVTPDDMMAVTDVGSEVSHCIALSCKHSELHTSMAAAQRGNPFARQNLVERVAWFLFLPLTYRLKV